MQPPVAVLKQRGALQQVGRRWRARPPLGWGTLARVEGCGCGRPAVSSVAARAGSPDSLRHCGSVRWKEGSPHPHLVGSSLECGGGQLAE